MKIAQGAGVVTNFITMADDFDEIDWEWVGSDLNSAQSNFYSKGIRDFTNGMAHEIEGDHSGFHDYTLVWTPDLIQWTIDGNLVRTVERKDSRFPVSPARIEIGLWDGGSGSKGTSDWAGGKIDWDSPDVASKGYFGMLLQSVKIECTGNPTSSDSDFALTFQNKPNFTNSNNQDTHHSTMVIKGRQETSFSLALLPLPAILTLALSLANTYP
ncbi:putative glycosidase CRH2 [Entomophthora muscae]|uniref:Glycosidase CRH2 n=1 Tax=Entomophthora muscae TaxID=34485 RepID=A0ACC2RND0_9FUNG|nr:putative glycosidase CRH2 [Entomophthora muscae]